MTREKAQNGIAAKTGKVKKISGPFFKTFFLTRHTPLTTHMKTTAVKTVTVTLEMNEREARWLCSFLRDPRSTDSKLRSEDRGGPMDIRVNMSKAMLGAMERIQDKPLNDEVPLAAVSNNTMPITHFDEPEYP